MATTAQMIDDVLARCGIETTPAHVSRTNVESWLNEAQRKLCAHGKLLATIWRGKSQAGADVYQLPGEFYQIWHVEVADAARNHYAILDPMTPSERNPNRTAVDGDFPKKYMVWGANDIGGSTDNKPVLVFDQNFGHTSADWNLFIWARQKPKTMADAGQGPEVQEYWQDGMKDYAEYRTRYRIGMGNRDEIQMADRLRQSWERFLEESKEYRYDALLVATYAPDSMNYTNLGRKYR